MTRQEVRNALACCEKGDCMNCPYYDVDNCNPKLSHEGKVMIDQLLYELSGLKTKMLGELMMAQGFYISHGEHEKVEAFEEAIHLITKL